MSLIHFEPCQSFETMGLDWTAESSLPQRRSQITIPFKDCPSMSSKSSTGLADERGERGEQGEPSEEAWQLG